MVARLVALFDLVRASGSNRCPPHKPRDSYKLVEIVAGSREAAKFI
jgi:hypothetical protein